MIRVGLDVPLVGEDGNAFAILGRVTRAMRRARVRRDVIDQYVKEATSGDYAHLLAVTMEILREPEEGDDDGRQHN